MHPSEPRTPLISDEISFIATHGRMLANFGGEYILRSFSNMISLVGGNFGEAWILGHIVWLSMDTKDQIERKRIWDLDKAVQEHVLSPVRVASLARAAGIPYETTKRVTASLVAKGICVKIKGGYVPSEKFMASESVVRATLANAYAMSIMVKNLEASGMLEYMSDRDFSSLSDVSV